MFHWCFIGTGALANKVARQLLKSGKHDIVSCYSRNEKTRNRFASKFHCRGYSDPVEAMNDENVDAVYVVTPHNVHFRFASMAIEIGKPVLLEKPFTVTLDETRKLIAMAEEHDVFLSEAMWTWYSGASLMVKKWIDENRIGQIRNVSFSYHFKSIGNKGRLKDSKRAGGALLDIGVYPISYAYHLFGMPEKIECQSVMQNGVDLKDEICFSYPDGKKVHMSISIVDFRQGEKLAVEGEKGKIIVPSFHHSSYAYLITDGKKKKCLTSKKRFIDYVTEFDEVERCVRAGLKETEPVTHQSTIDVMSLIEEVRRKIGLVYSRLES